MYRLGDWDAYSRWTREQDALDETDRKEIRCAVGQLPRRPFFSLVVLASSNNTVGVLPQALVASVMAQLYPFWELWTAAASKPVEDVIEAQRFQIIPNASGNPAVAFNIALGAAMGEFVVPLAPDAVLAEHALYELADALAENPHANLLYSDEDRLDAIGNRCHPRFKTAWDPDLMLGRDAVGHLSAYSIALLRRIGGMQAHIRSVDLALYDLALRVGFEAGSAGVCHIPSVLCHRSGASEAALGWDGAGARDIVRRHLLESGEPNVEILSAPLAPSWNRIARPLADPLPLVSVIIPTRDRPHLLERCADAVLSRTDYAPLELLVVDNDSREQGTLELFRWLALDRRVRILRHPGPFNFSALNNYAAREARGEVLVLLNNDTDTIEPGWLREMVSHALRPGVGAVGAKLLYSDGRVQHAGMVLGPDGALIHQLRLSGRMDPGPGGELALTRTVSAVTAACLALRRSVFFEVGGLDEANLAIAFNDVDLCLRIGDHGYRVVWTPFAELLHLESASRGNDNTPEKRERFASEWLYIQRTWGPLLEADPFHNRNLVFRWEDSILAVPPRRERPWRRSRQPLAAITVPSVAAQGT